MTKIDFIKELKKALYILMGSGEKYYFNTVSLPENNEDFFYFTQEYFKEKLSYKGTYWYKISNNDFSIELDLPYEIKEYFSNNEIPKFIQSLDAIDFEIIGSIFFKEFFNNLLIEENRQGCDDGIDFYGYYNSDGEVSKFTAFFQKNTWYIGQIKQYSYHNTIGTKYIRELLGTVELAKHNIWSLKDSYSNLNIKHHESIIPIFLTSSRYSRVVIDISRRLGIKLLDDIDLVFWLTILYEGKLDNLKKKLSSVKAN